MFPSTTSASHSRSWCPTVTDKGKGAIGFPAEISNYATNSTWKFGTISSPTVGAPSYSGFGRTDLGFSPMEGNSNSGNLWSPSVFMQGNQKGNSFSPNTLTTENVFGSPIGMKNSQGTSTLSTQTTFGAPSLYDYRSSSSGGFHAPISTFNSGGFGFGVSSSKSTSSSLSPLTSSWGTNSISTTPVKHNPFLSVPTKTATWQYPGPTFTSQPLNVSSSANTCLTTNVPSNPFGNTFHPVPTKTATWQYAGPTFTSQPLNFSSSANTCLTTNVHSNSFNPDAPRTTLKQNPFTNPNFAGVEPPSSLTSGWSTGPISMVNATANSVSAINEQSVKPSTQNFNGEIIGVVGGTSVSQLTCSSQITNMELPSPASTPFGTLPKPQMISESFQYGISSIPVREKPVPVKHPLLTTRHLSRRSKLPLRKYDPKPKIPYFSDTNEIPVAIYLPRDNPRALIISPNINPHEDQIKEKESVTTILNLPLKLKQPDYYTKPQISELESKEQSDPGFCRHVKDFTVGRHGYGSIKFLGETDVRNLDLETLIQFNNREITVFMDETMKPPVGEGLNKAAEITLVNIKCTNMKNVLNIDKYVEMLKKKAVAQGAEFVSYDPVEGEWKFRVQHF